MPQILLINRALTYSLLSVLLSFILHSEIFAQKFEIGATAGVANYIGDLAPTPVLKETKGAGGVFARINLSPTWAWTNSLMFAEVSGNDQNFSFNSARNLNFKSSITEVASVFEFNYLKYGVGVLDNSFTSYLFLGFAFFGFDPIGYYNGQYYELRNFQTEGPSNTYQPYSFAIPFGMGLKWRINRNYSFECQFGFRKTYTDYLDDVSKTYPNMQEGSVVAMLSDPSILINGGKFVNKNGYKRGNSDFNDWYMIAGVSLSYRFYPKIKCARFY